jgi:hypothetical protein
MSELNGTMSVKTTDAMSAAYKDAMARVEKCAVTSTIIDGISKEDWFSWDASSDIVIVCGKDCEADDDSDDEIGQLAA